MDPKVSRSLTAKNSAWTLRRAAVQVPLVQPIWSSSRLKGLRPRSLVFCLPNCSRSSSRLKGLRPSSLVPPKTKTVGCLPETPMSQTLVNVFFLPLKARLSKTAGPTWFPESQEGPKSISQFNSKTNSSRVYSPNLNKPWSSEIRGFFLSCYPCSLYRPIAKQPPGLKSAAKLLW